jgi:hypothetical protein
MRFDIELSPGCISLAASELVMLGFSFSRNTIEDGRVGLIGGNIAGPIVISLKNISLPGSGGCLSIWSTLNPLIFTLAWARSGELPWMLKPG